MLILKHIPTGRYYFQSYNPTDNVDSAFVFSIADAKNRLEASDLVRCGGWVAVRFEQIGLHRKEGDIFIFETVALTHTAAS